MSASFSSNRMSGGMLLGLYLTVMAVLIGGFFFLRRKFRKEDGVDKRADTNAAAVAEAPAAAAAGAGRRAGARPRGALERMRRDLEERKGDDAEAHEDAAAAGDDDEMDDDAAAAGPLNPAERKAAAKAAAAAARAEVRAAQEASEAHKRGKADKYEEKRLAREAERAAQEAEAAKAEAERQALIAKKEQEEFDQWKDMFTVSDAGLAQADGDAESQGMLEEFVQHIKKHKVVVLDEVAAQFKMKTPDVVARIHDMEAEGRLNGVIDDRGKYLCLTMDELDAVARFINKRGRVSIADIVAESNKLIDLSGTAEETTEQLVLEDDEKQ